MILSLFFNSNYPFFPLGDLDKIRVVGRYFVEIWKAAGMKMHNVKFLWASDEINNHSNEYWLQVIDITRNINITRMKKCS